MPGTYPSIPYKTYPVQHYQVTVSNKVEDGFIIDHTAIDKTLDYGQTLDLTPLVVHATYEVGDDQLLTTEYTVNVGEFSATTPGTYTITVSYKSYPNQTFEVTVADKVENGFEIDYSLVDTELEYGQLLNTDSLKVYATYVVGDRELLNAAAYNIYMPTYVYNSPGTISSVSPMGVSNQTFEVTSVNP